MPETSRGNNDVARRPRGRRMNGQILGKSFDIGGLTGETSQPAIE